MEEVFANVKENFQEKEGSPLIMAEEIGNSEDGDVLISASKLKLILEKLTHGQTPTSGAKQRRTTRRCLQESYLQNQFDREPKIPEFRNMVSLNGNNEEDFMDKLEIRGSDSLNTFCGPASTTAVNFPVNIRSSKLEILIDNLNPCRRTKSTCDLGIFLTEYALAAGPKNMILSPLGQWLIDAMDKNSKEKNTMKTPLGRSLGSFDVNVDFSIPNSESIKDVRHSGPMSSPLGESISSPLKLMRQMTPLRKQRYSSELTDKTPVSCSSTNSTYSGQSSYANVCTGLLHCAWKDGLPYFMFTVDDLGDTYVASPHKVESLADKALDYIYLFHSTMHDKRDPFTDSVSGLVGKMKVSSSLTICSDNVKLMETEFVMFRTSGDASKEMQNSTIMHKKSKGLQRKVVDMFKANHTFKRKSTPIRNLSMDFSGGPFVDMLDKLEESCKLGLNEVQLPHNLELAAIVVKDYHHDKSQEKVVGGWGLKFLKQAKLERENKSSENDQSGSQNQENPSRSINVLVPAGLHGGPKTRNGGPSSLTERWRGGGRCDCGGWDLGCPLTVLNSRSSNSDGSTGTNSQDCNSCDLYVEGTKKDEPTLTMVDVHEGLYFIQFRSTLSALQSFAVGVAIVHSKNLSLYPRLYRS